MSKHFDQYTSFSKAEKEWDKKADQAKKSNPLKVLKNNPKMPGITKSTARFLKVKSLYYMIKDDHGRTFPFIKKKPFTYAFSLLLSYLKKKPFIQEGDFYLYGIKSIDEFEKKLSDENTFFLLGFSYCHKPVECPSGRFTDQCIHDTQNPVCKQCFIGKSIHACTEKNTKVVIIPTVHYIGQKVFETLEKQKDKEVIFLITACEMTLKMFADFGNMVKVKGIGVRLDGRICNTMKAFELSERGIKPGLTVVLKDTQKKFLHFLATRRATFF